MSAPRYSTLFALGLFAVLVAYPAEQASARVCQWFGSPPFCRGDCPRGWEYTGKRVPCTAGSMRYCCRPCGPAQYGTPGCPYPSFGKVKPAPRVPDNSPCPPRMFRGGDGQCYPRLN
jgi:hypothetical protein